MTERPVEQGWWLLFFWNPFLGKSVRGAVDSAWADGMGLDWMRTGIEGTNFSVGRVMLFCRRSCTADSNSVGGKEKKNDDSIL